MILGQPAKTIIAAMKTMLVHCLRIVLSVFCFAFIVGCSKLSDPTSEELIKTDPPLFLGKAMRDFTTPTVLYDLEGECDPKSFGIEYSYDDVVWTTLPGGCKNSHFKIHVLVNSRKQVYARAKTKFGFTSSAIASIRFLLPPTSPAYSVVTSGNAINEGDLGVQSSMGISMTSAPMASASMKLDSDVTGIVYGK